MPARKPVLPLSRLSALALANNISEALNDYLESDPEKENLAEYGTKIRNCLDTNLEHGVHNDVDGLLWRRLHDKEGLQNINTQLFSPRWFCALHQNQI